MTAKRAETTCKRAETAPNRSIFSGFRALFPRMCFADKELALCHPDDTSKPFARKDLRPIKSSESRQIGRNTLSIQEMRQATVSEEKNDCHTTYNGTNDSRAEPLDSSGPTPQAPGADRPVRSGTVCGSVAFR